MIIAEIYFFFALIYCLYKFGAYILKLYSQPFIWINSIAKKDENEKDSRFKIKLVLILTAMIFLVFFIKSFL
jgi:hypothetical protein